MSEEGIFDRIEKKSAMEEQPDVSHRKAKFIGRTDEHERLEREMTKAISGKGRILILKGEGGCGKSRIIYEFFKDRKDTIMVRGISARDDQPYQAKSLSMTSRN